MEIKHDNDATILWYRRKNEDEVSTVAQFLQFLKANTSKEAGINLKEIKPEHTRPQPP